MQYAINTSFYKKGVSAANQGSVRKRTKKVQYENQFEDSPLETESVDYEQIDRWNSKGNKVIRSNQASQYSKVNTEDVSKNNSQKKEMMFTEFWN